MLPLTRCHLYTVLSGNPAQLAPWYRDTVTFSSACNAYPARLTPALADALHTEAQDFLRDNEIDEPVAWKPPPQLLERLTLPGTDPDTTDVAMLHDILRHEPRLSLPAAARHLATTPDAVCHILTLHPTTAAPSRTERAVADLAHRLSRDELEILLRQDGMTLRDIAARYDVTRTALATLTQQYGLETAGRSPHDRDNDTDPTRDDYAATPTLLRPAVAHVGGAALLDQFTTAVQYPSIAAAATELGINRLALANDIAHLEMLFGERLLHRGQNGHRPMALTPLGTRICHAWHAPPRWHGAHRRRSSTDTHTVSPLHWRPGRIPTSASPLGT